MQAEKTSSEDATIEKRTDLAFNEASNGCSPLARVREKGLEALSHDFVEERLLRLVALVLGHADPVGTGGGGQADRILELIESKRRPSPATATSGQDEPPEPTSTVGYTSA